MITTRPQAAARYDHLITLIDTAIADAATARADHDHDRAESLMSHANHLEDQAMTLARRFDVP